MSNTGQPTAVSKVVQIEPWIDESELRELQRVIASTFITENDLTREFECMTAELTGSRHAIAVCNGTIALFVALRALDIGPGDEVIVPDLTFVATANAVLLAGATPVLCDICEDTFCLDISAAEKLLTKRTKAIMPVHLYGQSANIPRIAQFARKNGLNVIEDAAEGIGVRYLGRHVGTCGEMGILSYYGNKTVTCGEGGVILTNDDDLAKKAFRLKNHGRDKKGTFVHDSIGFNFSFTDLQAAIGISQMKKMARIVQRKREIHDHYIEKLSDIPAFRPTQYDPACEPVFWFTSFLCDQPEGLLSFLADRNIQTRRFFYPLHLQPCFADGKLVRVDGVDCRVAERIYQQGISLPSSYSLTEEGQDYVIDQIHKFYEDSH
jgi:perosamine synthetase